jgi:hypothetical protein
MSQDRREKARFLPIGRESAATNLTKSSTVLVSISAQPVIEAMINRSASSLMEVSG